MLLSGSHKNRFFMVGDSSIIGAGNILVVLGNILVVVDGVLVVPNSPLMQ